MKKLLFIALFAIGSTATMSAQCDYNYVTNLSNYYSTIGGNAVSVSPSAKTASVDINGTEYVEALVHQYPIGGDVHMYEVEVFAGSVSYYFIIEINTVTDKITSYDICKQ